MRTKTLTSMVAGAVGLLKPGDDMDMDFVQPWLQLVTTTVSVSQ